MHHTSDFTPEDRLKHAPFGHGNRKCIGEDMARVIALLVLALMLQRYSRWELVHPNDDSTVYAMTEHHRNSLVKLRKADTA